MDKRDLFITPEILYDYLQIVNNLFVYPTVVTLYKINHTNLIRADDLAYLVQPATLHNSWTKYVLASPQMTIKGITVYGEYCPGMVYDRSIDCLEATFIVEKHFLW